MTDDPLRTHYVGDGCPGGHALCEHGFEKVIHVCDKCEIDLLRGALREIDRLVVDAFDCTDPIIYEKDWGSDSPKDSLRTLHAILTKIRARAALEEP
jgi:hypothetical protein